MTSLTLGERRELNALKAAVEDLRSDQHSLRLAVTKLQERVASQSRVIGALAERLAVLNPFLPEDKP